MDKKKNRKNFKIADSKTEVIEVRNSRLPKIDIKIDIKKKGSIKSQDTVEDSVHDWLAPGISLPKLHTREKQDSVLETSRVAFVPYTGEVDYEFQYERYYEPGREHEFSDSTRTRTSTNTSSLSQFSQTVRDPGLGNYATAVGPSQCDVTFGVPSISIQETFDELKDPNDEIAPSNALKQWELWMKRRRLVQNRLSRKSGRSPCDLLMNSTEDYRKVGEDKTLLQYASLPKADKWRGHPYIWLPEVSLGDRSCSADDPSKENCPIYFATKSLLQRGIVPSMEFIDTPNAILSEKGLICEKKSNKTGSLKAWENSAYRAQKMAKCKVGRKKIKPHNIDFTDLAVFGEKIYSIPQKKSQNSGKGIYAPKIKVSEPEDDGDIEHESVRSSVVCLVIGDVQFKEILGAHPSLQQKMDESKSCIEDDSEYVWKIDFGLNLVGSHVEKSITLENRGTMAITYDWVCGKDKRSHTDNTSVKLERTPWFFFDKNSGIIVPGEIRTLKFFHHTSKPGVKTEIWHLKTTPVLFENAKFLLSAASHIEYGDSNDIISLNNDIENYLEKRVKETIIKSILDKILYEIRRPRVRGIEYPSFFTEKELFEFHNTKYFYHIEHILELKKIFVKLTSKSSSEWDLSFDSLLDSVKKWKNESEKEQVYRQISERAVKLLRPNYTLLEFPDRKYQMVYQILCKMTNYMEFDYEYTRRCLSFSKPCERHSRCSCTNMEEYGEDLPFDNFESYSAPQMKYISPINLIFFQTMVYIKIYRRLTEAVESIAGVLETNKFLQPKKTVSPYTTGCF